MYGPHLTLDVQCQETLLLSDVSYISELLSELPALIGMQKIAPPYVFRYDDPDPKESGITGFTVISTSHLAIHTYEDKDYFFMDVFSCKPFDSDFVVNYIKQKFPVKHMTINMVERGKDFPR